MPRSLASRFKTNVLPDGSLELTSFDATDYDASTLEIPAEISGRPVKALGDFFSADSGKTLTSVRLPAGLERIGDCAFADCKRLSSLVFPSSLAEVGGEAFEGCSALTQLVIPANVREIDFGAVARCAALAKIDVAPENPRFRSVDGVLFDAETKTLLAFPPGGSERYVVPDGVERIEAKAFYGAERLVEIRLPASLRDVGVEAFGACASLTQIVLPEGVKSVGDRAFSDCSALSALRFPASLETLGDEPFVGCAALAKIDVAPENPRFRSVDGVLFDAETKTLLAFPPGGSERCVVPNGVERIAYGAFEFSPRLAEIVLPASVRSVGAYAFYECSDLTAIRFPAALCELGYSAFYRCEALRQVEFAPDANGLKTLPGKAFARCAALQNVALPNGLETIENLAFSDCAALREVRVPASVKSLDPSAFDGCSAALTLVVDAGSAAERFAKNAGIRFPIADEADA
ncbi:MAG: leucine-rich repeat protein [Thermoguttaceae bacterium]|nr:leucine-rich repeat protein [Thermoguttaceae bacterium]